MEAIMRATKILTAEHDIILQVLASLDRAREKMEQGLRPSPDFLAKSVTFAQNFADRFHHFKEEYLMFGLLAEKKGGLLDLHMGVLRYGHELCRGYIREIAQTLDAYAEKDEMAAITVLSSIAAYTAVLRHHIHTEDRLFFPMVEKTLSDDEKEMLMAQFHKESATKDAATFRLYQDMAYEIASLLEIGG
jgi:hemerythrin-like domain-containing protein